MHGFKILLSVITSIVLLSCVELVKDDTNILNTNMLDTASNNSETFLIVLGTIQDAGSPHIGCKKNCCQSLFSSPDPKRKVVSLGVVDNVNHKKWLFEATPDLPSQVKLLQTVSKGKNEAMPDGIFLTHAHIGHYSGLMYLGREGMSANQVPVFAMPKMRTFLENNAPWNQLLSLNNISISALENEKTVKLSENISVVPFLVPHRDELSETVGYIIIGKTKKALFIPDINKWDIWGKAIIDEIKKVDYAFIDATFYSGKELNTRNISEIPHPFVSESMLLFENLNISEKNKIHFIHFNHTNPIINLESKEASLVIEKGFNIAQFGQKLSL